MTRITQQQLGRSSLQYLFESRDNYNKYADEVSSGLKVQEPGDSRFSATVNQYKDLVTKLDGHKSRVEAAKSVLAFQDNVVSQLNELMVRAREIANQNANETIGANIRAQSAKEVFEIRDHIAQLANSKYQDRYVFGGRHDDEVPFETFTYAGPGTAPENVGYAYPDITADPGAGLTRSVNLTDDFTLETNKPGNNLFGNALTALETIGRALAGYSTDSVARTGVAYTLPADQALQTRAIKDGMDALETARKTHVMPERISLGAKQNRIDTATALLDLSRTDAVNVLKTIQTADVDESATNLSQANIALQASYTVSAQVLKLNILNFL